MSGYLRWSGSDADAVHEVHNAHWRAQWSRESWPTGDMFDHAMQHSLRALAEQGYGQAEVAVMFGLSRERIRQFAERYGCAAEFRALGKGTKPRVWDAELGRFVAVNCADFRQQRKAVLEATASAARRGAAKRARHERRVEAVLALRAVAQELGRVPTLPEVVERVGGSYPSTVVLFWGRYSRAQARGLSVPYANLTRRWFRVAGVGLPRISGQQGHVYPELRRRPR